jgi:hypothetical protein
MAGRPMKDLALVRNGDSFRVMVWGRYARSISVRKLAEVLDVFHDFSTGPISVQPSIINESPVQSNNSTEVGESPEQGGVNK